MAFPPLRRTQACSHDHGDESNEKNAVTVVLHERWQSTRGVRRERVRGCKGAETSGGSCSRRAAAGYTIDEVSAGLESAPTGYYDAFALRHENSIDHVDHAVRLDDVGSCYL